MELLSGFTSLVEGAKDQLDGIIQVLTEEEHDYSDSRSQIPNPFAESRSGKLKNSATSASHSNVYVTRHDSDYLMNGPKSRNTRSNLNKGKHWKDNIQNSQLRQLTQQELAVEDKTIHAKLDASVSHDTFLFISGLISNPKKAKDVFMSYYTLSLENDRKRIQNFSMTKSQDKGRLGAPKDIDEIQCGETNKRILNFAHNSQVETDDLSCGQDKWSDDMSNSDIHTGVKRERDDELDESVFAEDVGIVSDFILKGAKKTLRFAEKLIETVDEKASAHLSLKLEALTSTSTNGSREKVCDKNNSQSSKDITNDRDKIIVDKTHIDPKNKDIKRARNVNMRCQKQLDWKSDKAEHVKVDEGWSYVSVKDKGEVQVYDDSSMSDLSEAGFSEEGFELL